jgi:hypothetical protein
MQTGVQTGKSPVRVYKWLSEILDLEESGTLSVGFCSGADKGEANLG